MHTDVWTYPEASQLGTSIDPTVDLSGYEVEATDGSIGKVDEATYDTGRSFLVVDTGPWIFGKKVMLPAGVIRSIDTTDERVFVNRTKDQIKDSPEYDDSMLNDESSSERAKVEIESTRTEAATSTR